VVMLAAGCSLTGAGRAPVALLLLAAGMLGVWAFPTDADVPEVRVKQPTLVVTPSGMIVRDGHGLRSWQFEDLVDVTPYVHEGRVGLLVVEKDGSRDFVENLLFDKGENLRDLIGTRLNPRAT